MRGGAEVWRQAGEGTRMFHLEKFKLHHSQYPLSNFPNQFVKLNFKCSRITCPDQSLATFTLKLCKLSNDNNITLFI